ncbi:fruit protein pKIWI502-like [Amaranthus tricolor]|uniref:fruit protein pKIWI502-like n=1 Tax=Amaranthus tricolor TaxID=29722 RepID=UPI00258543C5|nr:fruit protein pKIWI502-like [Amaranthus tricolor]
MAAIDNPLTTFNKFSQDTTVWTPTPISLIESAAKSLFHVSIDVSDAPEIVSSHTRTGQYLQLKVPDSPKPPFLAIASPPSLAAARGELQFLVKTVAGSTAELLCGLKNGDVVELTPTMGNGFNVDLVVSGLSMAAMEASSNEEGGVF